MRIRSNGTLRSMMSVALLRPSPPRRSTTAHPPAGERLRPLEHLDHPFPHLRDQQIILPRFEPPVLAHRDAERPRRSALPQPKALAITAHHRGVGRQRHALMVARRADVLGG